MQQQTNKSNDSDIDGDGEGERRHEYSSTPEWRQNPQGNSLLQNCDHGGVKRAIIPVLLCLLNMLR